MTLNTTSALPDRSRIVSLLIELSSTKLSSSDYNLAERLGHLIGLSGSVNLAHALRQLPNQSSAPNVESSIKLQDEVLVARERMMRLITGSFVVNADAQLQVPSADIGIRPQALLTYAPYRRFYMTHQVEMSSGIQNLRLRVRSAISRVSTELHQLAELDRTLDEGLAVHPRKMFDLTPKILEQRFKALLLTNSKNLESLADDDISHWLKPGAWLDLFHRDMCELLLAEFDVRFQPVLGLLEALNEHLDLHHDEISV